MNEIESLRSEVAELKENRRRELEEYHEERIANRKLPPMSQMSRIQKRYFLEPWMTTLTAGSGVIATLGFILAMFTPLHMEFSMLGTLFTLIGAGFLITKLSLMDWNSHTEGDLRSRPSNRY